MHKQYIDEYKAMYGLADSDFNSKILVYGHDVSAVNAELHAYHGSITGCSLSLGHAKLPFEDFSFDLALSDYPRLPDIETKDVEFHLKTIRELARVAKEARIFPLMNVDGKPSTVLGPVLLGLQQDNYGVEIREAHDPLQLGSHAMLRVWAQECKI